MEKLTFTLPVKRKSHTNKYYLIAEDVAQATKTKPVRWLREVKNNEQAVIRALARFKEANNVKNPAALFTWFLKDCKNCG